MEFEINKKKYTVGYDKPSIESEGNKFSFQDLKEMTLFVNKLSDSLEKELNAREEK